MSERKIPEYLAVTNMVNNIRHVLVNESFKLFARNNVIDLDHLEDTVFAANRMAGFSMMSDEFQEQLNLLMTIQITANAILKCIDDSDTMFEVFANQFKPYGMELMDIAPGAPLPWKVPVAVSADAPVLLLGLDNEPVMVNDTARDGMTLLVCKPYTFVLGRFQ